METVEWLGNNLVINSPVSTTLGEIHLLSYFYHWGPKECWEMPVTQRGVFCDLIRRQLRAENGSGNDSGGTPKNSYKEGNRI